MDTKSVGNSGKRKDYLSWDDYFMSLAFLAAQRSKDPVTQVGACIINEDKVVIGMGYNGFPNGCSDDDFPWNNDLEEEMETKKFYVCHAEMNAILNKNAQSAKGCTIYVSLFPCNECAKCIIQSGIKEVVYFSDKKRDKKKFQASRKMLDAAGVKLSQFTPKKRVITIDFSSIDSDPCMEKGEQIVQETEKQQQLS